MIPRGPFQPQPSYDSVKGTMVWCILDECPLTATAASDLGTVEMSEVRPQSCPCVNAIGSTQTAGGTSVRGWKLREIPTANPLLFNAYAVNRLQAGGHAHIPQLKPAAF